MYVHISITSCKVKAKEYCRNYLAAGTLVSFFRISAVRIMILGKVLQHKCLHRVTGIVYELSSILPGINFALKMRNKGGSGMKNELTFVR